MYFKCLLCKEDRKDMRSKVELDDEIINDWTLKTTLFFLFPNIEIEGSSKKACKKCCQRIKYFLEFSEMIDNQQTGCSSLEEEENDNDVDEEMPEAPETNAEASQQQNPVDAIDDKQEEPTSEARKDSLDLESFEELRKKYEALKGQFEVLEKDKHECETKNADLTIKNSWLRNEVESLRQRQDSFFTKDLQSLKAWKDLQDEKEKLSEMLQEEKDQHQKIVNENNQLKQELEIFKRHQTALEEKCGKLKIKHKIAEDQLANSQFSMLEREKEWHEIKEELEFCVKDLTKQKGALEDEVIKLKKEKGNTDELKKVKKNLEAAKSKQQSYKRRLTRAEKEVSELKAQQLSKIDSYHKFFETVTSESEKRIKSLIEWREMLTTPNANETSNHQQADTNDATQRPNADAAKIRIDPIDM